LTRAGKLNRGISVVDTVEILKGTSLTEEEYRKAALLGWCIELVRFSFPVTIPLKSKADKRLFFSLPFEVCSSRLTSSLLTT
jgi:hypothetical protein